MDAIEEVCFVVGETSFRGSSKKHYCHHGTIYFLQHNVLHLCSNGNEFMSIPHPSHHLLHDTTTLVANLSFFFLPLYRLLH